MTTPDQREILQKLWQDIDEFMLFADFPTSYDKNARQLIIDYAGMIRDDMYAFLQKSNPVTRRTLRGLLMSTRSRVKSDFYSITLVKNIFREVYISSDPQTVYLQMEAILKGLGYESDSDESDSLSTAWDSDHALWPNEPPARIDPDEMSDSAAVQRMSFLPARNARDRTAIDDATRLARQIVVLPLTKHSAEVECALLKSDLAVSLVKMGVDVTPSWAGGAKILVQDFGLGEASEFRVWFGERVGLGPHHVVVTAGEDEASIMKLLLRGKATVKKGGRGGGRTIAPDADSDSLFACSSQQSFSHSGVTLDEDPSLDDHSDTFVATDDELWWPKVRAVTHNQIASVPLYHIVVKNTFIDDFGPEESAPMLRSTRSVSSAP